MPFAGESSTLPRRPAEPLADDELSWSAVSPERAQAYGRLMQMVGQDGPLALSADECVVVREAADALFFCEDLAWDDEARDGLTQVGELAGDLVGSGRWGPQRAEQLLRDIEACGPTVAVG
jgi:hypothetical protein